MPFLDDVNPQPGAKFRRTTSEAFLCNAEEANALHSFPRPNRPGAWLTAAMIVLVCLALFGCSSEPSTVLTSRDKGAALACEGMTAVWVSDTRHECVKETL